MIKFEGTEQEYRQLNAISQSELKLILTSPKHYANRANMFKQTAAMDFGSAVHLAVLEPSRFKELYTTAPTVMPNGEVINKRTKAGKQYLEDFALANKDKIVIDEDDVESITGILNSLASHDLASTLFTGGSAEVRATWDYRGHKCKGAVDYFFERHPIFGRCIVELKTTRDASHEAFTREMHNRKYDFQQAFYRIGFEAERNIIVAVDNVFPYSVGVYDVESWVEIGKTQVDKSFDILEECLATNSFPGYTKQIEQLMPPSWCIAQQQESI